MKKRLLAIILCAVMIMTALPVMVMPAAATTQDPATCTHVGAEWSGGDGTSDKVMNCADCGTSITFKPSNELDLYGDNGLLGEEKGSAPTYTYLTQDVSFASSKYLSTPAEDDIAADIKVDLNGHTVTWTGAENASMIVCMENNAKLEIYDSVGTGGFSRNLTDTGWWLKANASGCVVSVYGGTATAKNAINFANNAIVKLYGGTVNGALNITPGGTETRLQDLGGHRYDSVCDTTCNVTGCGVTRAAAHVYDDEADCFCNVCNELKASHICSFAWKYVDESDADWVEGTSTGTKYKVATCGCRTIKFEPWDGVTALANNKNVYLTADTVVLKSASGGRWEINSGTVNVDLNGNTLTGISGNRMMALWQNTAFFNVYDSVGTGVMKTSHTNEPIYGGNFTMYGGTFVTNGTAISTGKVTLYGGTFDTDVSAKVATNYKSFKVDDGAYKVVPANDGVIAAAVRLPKGTSNYTGMSFKAIFADSGLENKGTANANFGIILIPAAKYDASKTKAELISAGGKAYAATVAGDATVDGQYSVIFTVHSIPNTKYGEELVAVKYVGDNLVGAAVSRSVKSVAEMALADSASYTEDEIATLKEFAGRAA